MSLTPEQIDMIKRLQPVFKEKMGKAIKGDDYIWLPTMEQDVVLSEFQSRCASSGKSFLLIPKPIDWRNPERGCLGMLHEDFKIQKYVPACKITNTYEYRIDHYYTINQKIHDYHVIDTDLFTALLKALCEQEGV
jgi:hypothetical protein